MPRNDPLRNFRFRIELDGITQAAFSEASGFDVTTEPIDYRTGTEPTHVRKLPGLTKYGNVTLKWGITDSKEIFEWHQQIVGGEIVRKTVRIVVIDEAGNDKARFTILEAWPTKYDPMDLNAKGNEVAIETLELVNEGVKREA
ncbi:MAG: phage tail protein [Planctomycetes bacterium]|nr:phage tail protein [Planctomycetota bacterium]